MLNAKTNPANSDPRIVVNQLREIDILSQYTWCEVNAAEGRAWPTDRAVPNVRTINAFRAVADEVMRYAHREDSTMTNLGVASAACTRQGVAIAFTGLDIKLMSQGVGVIHLNDAFTNAARTLSALQLKKPEQVMPAREDLLWIMPHSFTRWNDKLIR